MERQGKMENKIAVFHNHIEIEKSVKALFVQEGIHMLEVAAEEELMNLLQTEEIQLLLIATDLDTNGMGKGIELVGYLRKQSPIPIIIVSGQKAETAKIMALNAGADDYIMADCNPLELIARVKSQLRRYMQLVNWCVNLDNIYKVDGLVVNDIRRTVSVDGKEVKLTPIEYKILRLLVQQHGRVLSIGQIYEAIWNMRPVGVDNTIAVHIRHIREKIERNPKQPRYLKVVWGTGYKVG